MAGGGLKGRVGAGCLVALCGPCLGSGAVAELAGRDAEREAERRAAVRPALVTALR